MSTTADDRPVLPVARAMIAIALATAALMMPAPASATPSVNELDRRITFAARRLEAIVEQYNESREDLHAIRVRQRELAARIGPMTDEVRRREQLMDGLASRTYQRTVRGPTVALFGSENPRQFVAKLLTLHEMATGQQHAVRDLVTARAEVSRTRTTLARLAAQQRRTQAQLTQRKIVVEGEIAALKQMRQVAYSGGSRYSEIFDHPPPYVAGPAGRVVAFAYAQLGKPYRWGAEGPESYDCSGLTLAAWDRAGVRLPHNAARQYHSTARIRRSEARPGDLVFFYGGLTHVGVYIGRGMMIHAPEFGENVRIAPISSQPVHGFGRPVSPE